MGIEDRAAAIARELAIEQAAAQAAQTRAREQAASAAKQWHTDVYSLLDEFFDLAEKHAAPTSKVALSGGHRKYHAYGRLYIARNPDSESWTGDQPVLLVKPRRIAGSVGVPYEKAIKLSKVKLTIWRNFTPYPIGRLEGALAHIVAGWRV